MSIESFFFPKESLQGAEIPAHIIWKDISFSFIRAEIPPCLRIKQLFNVNKNDWKSEPFGFVVKKVQVDGYLGMVLESRLLDDELFDVWVNFSFLKEGQIVEKISRKIHLFRPKIMVERVPDEIEVNVEKHFVLNRIGMRNSGEGTAIILVKTLEDSEIEKALPQSVKKFREKYYEDAKKNLSSVKKKFPTRWKMMSEYLEIIHLFLTKRQLGRKHYKRMERTLTKLVRIFETDEDFQKAFIEAIGEAYLKNIRLMTIFDDFLDYFNSIASKKVLIPDPLWVFPVSTDPKELCLEILTTDLMINEYPPIIIPKVKLLGNNSGEVPIYRLFEWR